MKLDERMKKYEGVSKMFLTVGVPKVIRLDMRAGSTFTKHLKKPFDPVFSGAMEQAAQALCKQIQGAAFAYTQSDEISLILNDGVDKDTQTFFDGNVEKIVSISASICTLEFNKAYSSLVQMVPASERERYEKGVWSACFDSRVFMLPNVTEVHNYVLWRQQDAIRNSVQMVGRSVFSARELKCKSTTVIKEMLKMKSDVNWEDFAQRHRQGIFIVKEKFTKDVTLPNGDVLKNVERSRWNLYDAPFVGEDKTFIEKLYNKYVFFHGELIKE